MLSDFGTITKQDNENTTHGDTTVCGTILYLAPEVHEYCRYIRIGYSW